MGREKKGGSKVGREEEETLLSPSLFLQLFSAASSYWSIIQNINQKGFISISYVYKLLSHLFNLCILKQKKDSGKWWKQSGMQDVYEKGMEMWDKENGHTTKKGQ